MSAPSSTPSPAPAPRRAASKPTSLQNGFELFAECLLTGVVVGVLALPLVTALPAVAAGTRHLRHHVAGEASGTRLMLRDAVAATRGSWLVSGALVLLLAVLGSNALLASTTALPGGGVLRWVMAVLAVAAVVVALRAAAAWAPGASWRLLVARAAHRSAADPVGSLLTALAVGFVVLMAWMLPPLGLPAVGIVVLGLVAVEARART
ncbi:hypothetical protein CLV92_11091 [Kineococcus xinjiangensis]|uniref:Uncharacterized protein n=1 Tax=Kineococcus xinjiangensis TaxID=512762 RepID=A0A2S6IGX3_9ACTN|nr:hypothetical protein [Kineococcus xinjiangensis]PPK93463.1 hypothetical protein CLV92_11091 [Kineococcus xinjiangensis]